MGKYGPKSRFSTNFVRGSPNPVSTALIPITTFVFVNWQLMRTPLFTRLICCWLALTVLVSSTGFGMVEHWCQMRGHSKTLLLTADTCTKACLSSESSEPVSDRAQVARMPCCKTTVSYQHLDVSRFAADHHAPVTPQPAGFIPNPEFRLLLAVMRPTSVLSAFTPLADDPLFRTGRFRLTSLCTWLI